VGPNRGLESWGSIPPNPATISNLGSTAPVEGEEAIWFSGRFGLRTANGNFHHQPANANYMGKVRSTRRCGPTVRGSSESLACHWREPTSITRRGWGAGWTPTTRILGVVQPDGGCRSRVPPRSKFTWVGDLSKDGHLYFLNSASLGMMDGHIVDLTLASIKPFGRAVFNPSPTRPPTGSHIALTIDRGNHGVSSDAGGRSQQGSFSWVSAVKPGATDAGRSP